MMWILLVSVAATLVALANISLKHGLTQVTTSLPQASLNFHSIPYLASNLYIWLGILGLVSGFACWLTGLSRIQLSNAYPVFVGVEYTLVILLSWLILSEAFAPIKIAGIVIVFIGIMVIVR